VVTLPPQLHPAILLFLLIGVQTACGPAGGTTHSFSEQVEAGVAVALNSGGPRFPGELFRYDQVAVLQQRPDRPESLLYQDIRFLRTEKGFLMGGDGRFYVGDSGGARIAVYGADGTFAASIGQRGQGPGEFMLMELVDLEGDVLVVVDHNLHRTTRYRTDGTLIGVVRDASDHRSHHGIRVDIGGPSHYDADGHLWTAAGFTARTSDGRVVGEAATREIKILYAVPGSGKGGFGRPAVPYVARPQGRFVPDGSVLLTDGVQPVLWWYEMDGSVRRRIEVGTPPRTIGEEERDRFLRDLDQRRAASTSSSEIQNLTYQAEMAPFPEHGSLWCHIMLDDHGCIWLEGHQEPFEQQEQGGGVTYYLLSPQGEFLGTTRAPGAGRVMRSHLMGEVPDPDTDRVEHVVWRLVPAAEGFTYPPPLR
jgi:hypothetical protein